jgi:mono/diheme cytochrome c family protein
MLFRRSRVVATFALAAFLGTLALPLFASRHGFGDDVDAGWGGQRLVTGHPVTQVEPVYPATADEHCAICHWARAFGSSVTGAPLRYAPPVTIAAIVVSPLDTASTIFLAVGPPRGPPSLS